MILQKCQILDFNGSDNGRDSNKMSILILTSSFWSQIVTYGHVRCFGKRITIDIGR